MSAARRGDPERRRAAIVAAAAELFAEHGVADTPVSAIVKRAGVAQGTFYLYFESKDDAVNAVVEQMLEAFLGKIDEALDAPGTSALQKLVLVRNALVEMSDEPHESELLELYHRPENRDVHDRLARNLGPHLAPELARIIEQGTAEGVFCCDNPLAAAWFILGGLSAIEDAFGHSHDFGHVLGRAGELIVRCLGCEPAAVEALLGGIDTP